MSYQIISRKYRPKTFASIVGQDAAVTTFKNALRSGKIAQAYLFCGCRGTGKTTFARILAKALNCAHLTDGLEPCNACPSCSDIQAGRSLDVLEIDGASNRGIDDIRNLNETVGYAPAHGKYKIYIIDEVHMLTKEAFNALLKTVEEPPSHVKFFFATTEPHKVLPTIISRCQRFDLSRIAPSAMIQKLKSIASDLNTECEEEVFEILSHLSEGSLRDAESLLDQALCSTEAPITAEKLSLVLGLMPRRSFFALDAAFDAQRLSFAFELAQDVFASGKDLAYFLDMLIDHYRTLLNSKLTKNAFVYGTDKERYQASALLYSEEHCLYILDYLIQWQQQLSKIPFKRIFLEMVLLHILRSKYRLSPATLVKRLTDLEHTVAAKGSTDKESIAHTPSCDQAQEKASSEPVPALGKVEENEQEEEVYRNNLKNRNFDKEASQNFDLERMTIVRAQGMSEGQNCEIKPTQSKTDSSNCFGIKAPSEPALVQNPIEDVKQILKPATISAETPAEMPALVKNTATHPSRYQTLLQFAAIELEGTVNK